MKSFVPSPCKEITLSLNITVYALIVLASGAVEKNTLTCVFKTLSLSIVFCLDKLKINKV